MDEYQFALRVKRVGGMRELGQLIGLGLAQIADEWPGIRAARLVQPTGEPMAYCALMVGLVDLPLRLSVPGPHRALLDLAERTFRPLRGEDIYFPPEVAWVEAGRVVLPDTAGLGGRIELLCAERRLGEVERGWVSLEHLRPEWLRWTIRYPEPGVIAVRIYSDGRLYAFEVAQRLCARLPSLFDPPASAA